MYHLCAKLAGLNLIRQSQFCVKSMQLRGAYFARVALAFGSHGRPPHSWLNYVNNLLHSPSKQINSSSRSRAHPWRNHYSWHRKPTKMRLESELGGTGYWTYTIVASNGLEVKSVLFWMALNPAEFLSEHVNFLIFGLTWSLKTWIKSDMNTFLKCTLLTISAPWCTGTNEPILIDLENGASTTLAYY